MGRVDPKESTPQLRIALQSESTPTLESTLVVDSEIADVFTDSQISILCLEIECSISAKSEQNEVSIRLQYSPWAVQKQQHGLIVRSHKRLRALWFAAVWNGRARVRRIETTFPHTFILREGYLLEINNSHSEFSLG